MNTNSESELNEQKDIPIITIMDVAFNNTSAVDNSNKGLMEANHNGEKVEDMHKKREIWNKKFDFMIACIGGAVGLGNVWRFPYLCYKNGGGAFLIPYFVCLAFASLPMFMLEVGLGQFMSASGVTAWSITPIFQGLGLATSTIIFYINIYYNVILAWALMYFFYSFASRLPWDRCDNDWNTPKCSTDFKRNLSTTVTNAIANNSITPATSTKVMYRASEIGAIIPEQGQGYNNSSAAILKTSDLVDSVTEFWENKVLRISNKIEDIGDINWDLALCLTLSWVIVYLCICKGIKSSGKVMYLTVPAPYVFMAVIIIRNATLPGAAEGVFFYLKPNMTKLGEISVWTDAVMQTFFSSCICQAVALSLGSYNKFKHNLCRDSIVILCVNAFTSFFAGFMVFTILGFMANQQGRPIAEVAESGPGLAFIAYPKAMAQMPLPQFWSVLFFLMLLLIGVDSQFVDVEALVTSIVDQFPNLLRRGRRKEIFTAVICFIHYLLGLSCIARGGIYVFQLLVYYGSGLSLLVVALLQFFAVSYVYGARRFLDNFEMMIGSRWMRFMRPYLLISWCVTGPIISLGIFVLSCIDVKSLSYERARGDVYHFPAWANSLGWFLTISCLLWIPFMIIHHFYQYGFSLEVFKLMFAPNKLKPHQMRPGDEFQKSLESLKKEQGRKNNHHNLSLIPDTV